MNFKDRSIPDITGWRSRQVCLIRCCYQIRGVKVVSRKHGLARHGLHFPDQLVSGITVGFKLKMRRQRTLPGSGEPFSGIRLFWNRTKVLNETA